MATKQLAKTFKYGIGLQSNWATPLGVTAAFKTIPYDAGVTIFDPGIGVELHNTSGQSGIHKEIERVYVDARSGLSRVNFSMHPVDLKTIMPHIAGSLFSIVEGAGSPFNKSVTSGGLTTVIDFNGDDTTLHTIAMDDKASADDGIILENAIIENLDLTWDFIATGVARLMGMSGNWVGNEMNFEQTITSGNWTTTTFTPMGDTDTFAFTTFTVDGQDWSAETIRRYRDATPITTIATENRIP